MYNIYSCNHGDFIVSYTSKNCPVCDIQKNLEDAENKIEELKEQYSDLESIHEDLEKEFDDFKTEYDFQIKMINAINENE